ALREQIIIMASEHQLSNQNLISDITDKLTAQGHNVSIVKEAMDGLSPQDIGILISDKVNDDIAQFKGESTQETKQIDRLVDDINKSHDLSDKEMKSLVDNIEKQDMENEYVENALSNYNHQKEIELKELELEKELSLPSL
ncbi:hypothetical protein, partial [Photobacterium damselae]|uniref:hypothetical protein n=1 Tax=Photobacterium damselae TaxID=38293 RepID=UPI00406807CE